MYNVNLMIVLLSLVWAENNTYYLVPRGLKLKLSELKTTGK